jgi:hypothetical protein
MTKNDSGKTWWRSSPDDQWRPAQWSVSGNEFTVRTDDGESGATMKFQDHDDAVEYARAFTEDTAKMRLADEPA